MMEIITRKEAISQGLKRYFTGKPCKWGHVAELYVVVGCVECRTRYRAEYRAKNKDRINELKSKSCAGDKEKNAKYNAEYYAKNKEKIAKYSAENRGRIKERMDKYRVKYYAKNKEKISEKQFKYYTENKEKIYELRANRRAKKINLTPPLRYQDRESVVKLFKTAKDLGVLTGGQYHVDHIWPISKGGVHHPCNLQVLEAGANLSKNATHDGHSGVSYDDFMLAVTAYA